MKRTNNNIENKIEEALVSLDDMHQAEANPFLYSKIIGRLHAKYNAVQNERRKFLRLSWELAVAMILFIGLNIATFIYLGHQNESDDNNNSISSVANEYVVNSNNYNYY